jgi:hypothetical protein
MPAQAGWSREESLARAPGEGRTTAWAPVEKDGGAVGRDGRRGAGAAVEKEGMRGADAQPPAWGGRGGKGICWRSCGRGGEAQVPNPDCVGASGYAGNKQISQGNAGSGPLLKTQCWPRFLRDGDLIPQSDK